MMLIRPIEKNDIDALYTMAENAGVGFTSLPADRQLLKDKMAAAEKAFNSDDNNESNQSYLFVLEDTENQAIAGVCGIESALGLDSPWYNYRLGTLVHASPSLKVYGQSKTLSLSNDHTGYSELCTLFLSQDYRHSKNGSLLSKSRFMFMANFPNRFHQRVIAEMRGVSDDEGNSPFWNGLGAHFFSMPFAQADNLSGLGNKSFIAELMPKLPIYIDLLSPSVQAVIGQVHENTLPALKMLENEGFQNLGYVDIFDGGPTIEADVRHIRAINQNKIYPVCIGQPSSTHLQIVSNTGCTSYRCTLANADKLPSGELLIDAKTAKALNLKTGDLIRSVSLSSTSLS
ncbi:arginine N-succinyltransferase [Marinomonas algicola]|uniref:arginine N-succinyltransferase n=1 Tax=Marinomonas algicola TaxID=2773454 RepID=UPI0017496589|nr:arginine N-succinyltransferase [Marinomonas algicola]